LKIIILLYLKVDDVPAFLDGEDKKNALHLLLNYRKMSAKSKKRELAEIKKKILELKKDMVFTNSLKTKITQNLLNTPRTHRSDNFLIPINEDNLQLTNRTNKSVRFDDDDDYFEDRYEFNKTNSSSINPLTKKYTKLLDELDIPIPLSSRSDTSIHSKALNLSLPLSLDPMSTLDSHHKNTINRLEIETSRSVQSLDAPKNEEFLVE
jgi:DNA-directed RNA polymerase beta' subunit